MAQADGVSLSVANDADEFKINIVEVREPDAQEPDKPGRMSSPSSFDDKENTEDQEGLLHEMCQLRISELEHGVTVLQKRHKAKVAGLQDEIARLQAQSVKADCTEYATGDLSTTVSLLKAKLTATEEQHTADQTSLQRTQQMLASTQDNANLANSCLLKKVHAAQQATEAALAAEAACQEQCIGLEKQIASLKARLANCEQYFASLKSQQPITALHDSAGSYDPAAGLCSPTYTAEPAIPEKCSTDAYDPASGLQLGSMPAASTALTVWHAAAQPADSLLAQLSAQQQQHDHELTKMHQQYAQQVAQVQQDHLHQLATLEMQQPQHQTHRRTGVWQQIFGKQPGNQLQLNPGGPSPIQAALTQQVHEVGLAVTDALQLKHTEELHEVSTQLAAAQQQSANAVQELHECQHRLDSTDALHMQHILTMAELEQQLSSEKKTSSAQSQEMQQLQSKLAAADAKASQHSADMAEVKKQLSDTANTTHSQEQQLLQWQTKAADAESLQAQTASKMAAIQQQLASSQEACASQAAQLQQRQTELAVSAATHAQDSAGITTLQGQLAEATQAASSTAALQAQLADSQQICTEQAQQLEQLCSEHAASHAQNGASVAALEGQLAEAVQLAYSQEDLVQKYSMEHDNQRHLLEQAAVTSQNQQAEAGQTIAALQQQVAELQQASQQQYSTLQEETLLQLETVTEAEKMLVVLERDATQQAAAMQHYYESQLYDQQSQHSEQLAALQAEHDSQVASLLQQQPVVSCGSSLSGKPCPAAMKAIRHSTRLQQAQQTLHQSLQAGKAKIASKTSTIAELQHQLHAKSIQLERLQSKLEGQTGAAATYKASLKASYGHMTKLEADLGQARKGYDIVRTAFPNESQLHDKAKVIIAKLRQEMQAKQKHMKQLQASRDEVGAVAEGYNRIITKLEPVASQGRMMAALLEMLHSSLSLPASHMLGSPLQQFETLIADYTALRTQVYPDSGSSGSDTHADPADGLEDDWGIEDEPLT